MLVVLPVLVLVILVLVAFVLAVLVLVAFVLPVLVLFVLGVVVPVLVVIPVLVLAMFVCDVLVLAMSVIVVFVTDMLACSCVQHRSTHGGISKRDVSSATGMSRMFVCATSFNADIKCVYASVCVRACAFMSVNCLRSIIQQCYNI